MLIKDMTLEELIALEVSLIDDNGHEIPNPKPTVERVPGMKPDLETRIKKMIGLELRRRSFSQPFDAGQEDHDDFDIPDEEPMPRSGFEEMTPEIPSQPVDVKADTGDGGSPKDPPQETPEVQTQPETDPADK